jgi:hypothetical protein
MKRVILILSSVLISISLKAQITFSVSPGVKTNGSSFGYKHKNFNPYVGLQLIGGKGELIMSGSDFDASGNLYTFKNTLSAKLNVYMPTLGLKYFILEKNKLKAYGNLNFSKGFITGKIEDSTDPTVNADFQETRKNINLFGGQLGIGAEYFFDSNFSLGGEFGIMGVFVRAKDTYNSTINNPNTGSSIDVKNTLEMKLNLNPTYSKISLNYYFGN